MGSIKQIYCSCFSQKTEECEYITFYFNIGVNYNDIFQSLAIRHRLLSKRYFLCFFKYMGLNTRNTLISGSRSFHLSPAGRSWETLSLLPSIQYIYCSLRATCNFLISSDTFDDTKSKSCENISLQTSKFGLNEWS